MIEVELKALANKLDVQTLFDNGYKLTNTEKQLNHYFKVNSIHWVTELFDNLKGHLLHKAYTELLEAFKTNDVAIRTRWTEEQDYKENTYLIVKYSLTDTNHQNGISRKEIQINLDMDLVDLDNLLLDSGLIYASKWSRNRQIYNYVGDEFKDFKHEICLDTNAGYGKVLEIESVVNTEEDALCTEPKLRYILNKLGLEELDINLLEDMFNFYQKHWEEYYGTDKLIWNDSRFVSSLGQ